MAQTYNWCNALHLENLYLGAKHISRGLHTSNRFHDHIYSEKIHYWHKYTVNWRICQGMSRLFKAILSTFKSSRSEVGGRVEDRSVVRRMIRNEDASQRDSGFPPIGESREGRSDPGTHGADAGGVCGLPEIDGMIASEGSMECGAPSGQVFPSPPAPLRIGAGARDEPTGDGKIIFRRET